MLLAIHATLMQSIAMQAWLFLTPGNDPQVKGMGELLDEERIWQVLADLFQVSTFLYGFKLHASVTRRDIELLVSDTSEAAILWH